LGKFHLERNMNSEIQLEEAVEPIGKHGNLTETILGCCFDVMNELGTGFLEAVYKKALVIALQQKGLNVQEEVPFDLYFRGVRIGRYIADIVVENKVVIELKCCKNLLPEHQAQVINYLKASKLTVGLLVNFGQRKIEFKRLYG
jgi:GxxExxY protein